MKGKVGQGFGYKAEVDFANNDSKITDAYINYTGIDHVELKAGQFKEPVGLDNLTSSKNILFIERASATSLTPGRNIGLQASTYGDYWTLTGGVFGDDVGASSTDDEQYSVTARATIAPIMREDASVHLGVAGSFRSPDSASDSVRYRARPDTRLANLRSVDTGSITGVDDVTLLGLEVAAAWQSLFMQGEYTYSDISRDVGADVDVEGHYVQAAWTLTGETRPYDVKKGVYGRIKPHSPFNLKDGGAGAWEIAARYSNLDLNDGIALTGGEMDSYTLGLNWYPNNYVRFMANYIMVEADANGVTPNDEPHIFALRGQVEF